MYNGYKNWHTWNVALWLGNDEGLYTYAKDHTRYSDVAAGLSELGVWHTPDGVSFADHRLDVAKLNEVVEELS